MNTATTATQLQMMSIPQQYQVPSSDTPLNLPFDKANFSQPRLCKSICFSAANVWYSNNHCDADDQCDGLFSRAEETKRLLMPELCHIWATTSFWDWDVFGKISVADASLTVELRMAGCPKDENGTKTIDLYPTIWLRTADKVVRASTPWKEIKAVVKRLRLDSPQNVKIFVEGGGRLSDDTVSVAKEHLTLDKGITFPSGEALHINILAKPETSSACGLLCLITIVKDEIVLEQNISRIGGLVTYMLPRQAVTSGHVMAQYFLKSSAHDTSSVDLTETDASLMEEEESDENDIELVQNYESDHDPEKSLGYVDINGSTDWLSVTPSDTINFIIQLAKDKAQTSAWDIKTSQPISADFSLLSGMADWDCDNCYVEPPSSDSVTRVKKWVSGYNNDETLGAREVLILVNQESDSLVASLQSARIPLIIGSATIWTRKVCLQGPLAPGTSGSWVVDRISGALCGSIIIVYDGEPYALMMTAQTLLSDIRAYSSMAVDETMFPTVSEPMQKEVEELQPFVRNAIPGKSSLEVDSTSDDHDSDTNCSPPSSVSSTTSSIFKYDVINSRTYQTVHGKYWAPTDQVSLNAMEVFYQTAFLVLRSKLYLAPLDANQVHSVLDIGTGSGTWAMDFADDCPEAEVIGIDISPIQPIFVPPNLQFEIDDFTKEWTFEANSRDFIHMRFLGGGVSDWRSLYENAFRVTKPGGWIETHEFDPRFHSQNDSIVHGSAIAAWNRIFEEGCKKLGTSFIPIPSKVQQEHLEAVGFVDIQSQIIRVPVGRWAKEEYMKEIGTFALGSITSDIHGWINFMAYTCDWKEDDIREYCVRLREELATKTTQLYYYQQIVWGRKPHD